MNQLNILFQEILDKCDEVERIRSESNSRWWMLIESDLQIMQNRLAEACLIDPNIKKLITAMNIVSRAHDETYFRELEETYKAMRIEIHDEKLPLINVAPA